MKLAKKILIFLLVFSGILPQVHADGEKWVALTFDDGPSEATELLLGGLAERDVRATFFLCGYRIKEYPNEAAAIAQAGHELGVHGYSHGYFPKMTPEKLRQEIADTAALLTQADGTAPTLLRPPGGLLNDEVSAAAREAGFPVILWTLDPEDWDPKQRSQTADRVVRQAKSGDIILLHDLSAQNARSALESIDRLKEKGFRFCTVTELAEKAGTELMPGTVYRGFSL